MDEIQIKSVLRETNRTFRSVEKKHSDFENVLNDLNRRKVLTPAEEVQKKVYQKQKLAAKDSMVEMIRNYQNDTGMQARLAAQGTEQT